MYPLERAVGKGGQGVLEALTSFLRLMGIDLLSALGVPHWRVRVREKVKSNARFMRLPSQIPRISVDK